MTPALLDDVLAFADHVGLKTRARVRDTSLSEMPREATEGASSGKSTLKRDRLVEGEARSAVSDR
jgi:hypothetical protein